MNVVWLHYYCFKSIMSSTGQTVVVIISVCGLVGFSQWYQFSQKRFPLHKLFTFHFYNEGVWIIAVCGFIFPLTECVCNSPSFLVSLCFIWYLCSLRALANSAWLRILKRSSLIPHLGYRLSSDWSLWFEFYNRNVVQKD